MTHMPDIKWGIIDYYAEKKAAYAYVQRAYQPLLVSLAYPKRRWNEGETFTAEIHLTNDFHEAFSELQLYWEVEGTSGELACSAPADSSEAVHTLSWPVSAVSAGVKGLEAVPTFSVTLRLERAGETLSHNHYELLIDDQAQAKVRCAELFKTLTARKGD